MQPDETSPAAGKIASLDGIRGVSFLIVFLSHAGLERIVPGRLGVNIFFLLSGYLITTLLIRERETRGSLSLRMFYARRAIRIFPPMYVIYGAALLYLWLTHQTGTATWGGICSQLFYYQNYWFHGGIYLEFGLLWSLAVEEHFYILFPPLMLLLFKRLKRDYLCMARTLLWICAGILVWRCCVVGWMPGGIRWAQDASDTRADSILFGCVLACLEKAPLCGRLFEKRRLERWILPGSAALLAATLIIRNPIFRETLRYTFQAIAFTPWLYYVVKYPACFAGRFLNAKWLCRLGVLSYPLYLVHETVLRQISSTMMPPLLAVPLSFAIALALACLVHEAIEKPADRLRRRWRGVGAPAVVGRVPLVLVPAAPEPVLLTV